MCTTSFSFTQVLDLQLLDKLISELTNYPNEEVMVRTKNSCLKLNHTRYIIIINHLLSNLVYQSFYTTDDRTCDKRIPKGLLLHFVLSLTLLRGHSHIDFSHASSRSNVIRVGGLIVSTLTKYKENFPDL